MVVILALMALVSLFLSLMAFSTAQSVLHEIFAGIGIICFVLCLGFAGVIEAINRISKQIKEYCENTKKQIAIHESVIKSGPPPDPNEKAVCVWCRNKYNAIAMKNVKDGKGACIQCYDRLGLSKKRNG